jgi:hypothetical protein
VLAFQEMWIHVLEIAKNSSHEELAESFPSARPELARLSPHAEYLEIPF